MANRLNRAFAYDLATQQYFTFLYGILDLKESTFRYTSAGHPGPLVVHEGEARLQAPTPPGIGIVPESEFVEQILHLDHGDRLFLYTDGMFEIDDEGGEEYGEKRLCKAFADSAGLPLEDSVRSAMATVRGWHGGQTLADDLSLTAIEIR